jgi:hypothetical protein
VIYLSGLTLISGLLKEKLLAKIKTKIVISSNPFCPVLAQEWAISKNPTFMERREIGCQKKSSAKSERHKCHGHALILHDSYL